jgi:hypothetical protein
MGSVGKGRNENRWDVSGAGHSAQSVVYLIFPRKYIKKSAADRQSDYISVRGDTAVLIL